MIKILEVIKDKNCNGCGACLNKCPQGAISMQVNNEGFLYPVIDESKCVNCGLCDKVCSYLNNGSNNSTKPDCYMFCAEDEERRYCSSGGAFPILAKYFVENGDYVCGAIWDEDWNVKHIVSNKFEDVEKMRRSKYIQSDTKNCYQEIKSLLKQDKKVFFTGTPCQVSGLKNFLGKEFKNLYTMDLICHGASSPKVLHKYLEENFDISNIENVSFRNKIPDGCSSACYVQDNKHVSKNRQSGFWELFSNNASLRSSCGKCVHNKLGRQGDITVGDFWEIGKYGDCVNDNLGISVVLDNKNKKSKFLIEILRRNAKIMNQTPLSAATKRNINIYKSSTLHKNRDLFFENIDKMSIEENILYTLKDKCDCMILNFWSSMNYGAILTSLGVQSLMDKLGYRSKIINYVDNLRLDTIKGSFCEKFANKYLNMSNPVETWDDFLKLNDNCDTFITGSDQVFNTSIMKSHTTRELTPFIYLLDFVKNNKKKLSYAGSFGTDSFIGPKEFETMFKNYLSQLDYISLRENEGKKIVDSWGLKSEVLIDAAFHIPRTQLEEMTAPYKTDEKYIAYFGLPYDKGNKNIWKTEVAQTASKKLGLPIKTIAINDNISVEQWLAFIKNAELVISDSYHSIVFSIIFNKKFIQLVRDNKKNCRFTTMYKSLGLKNNGVSFYGDYRNIEPCLVEPNWDEVNKRIEAGVQYAEKQIKSAIETPKNRPDAQALDAANLANTKHILLERKLPILLNSQNIKKKYRKYKIMKTFSFGKSKKRYKQKYQEYRKLVELLRRDYSELMKF